MYHRDILGIPDNFSYCVCQLEEPNVPLVIASHPSLKCRAKSKCVDEILKTVGMVDYEVLQTFGEDGTSCFNEPTSMLNDGIRNPDP